MTHESVTGSDEHITDVAAHLEQLGQGRTKYPTCPEEAVLETFENRWFQNGNYTVELECPEFTSLCPKTGQPDFAHFTIAYIPDRLLIESKALKLYLFSYRNHGEFHESVTNRIGRDLYNAMNPRALVIRGDFYPRGGISINPLVKLGDSDLCDEIMRNWRLCKPAT